MEQRDRDLEFMQLALACARRAAEASEVPVGAVVAIGGRVVGRGRNRPISAVDPTAHAEIEALRAAAAHVGNYRLSGASLYVTVEPCLMCAGALVQARVRRLVYGCREPKFGALGSSCDLHGAGGPLAGVEVRGGICAEDASLLLTSFFRARRGA